MKMKEKLVILDASALDRALERIAHEIVERTQPIANIAIVGIRTRGAFRRVESTSKQRVPALWFDCSGLRGLRAVWQPTQPN